MCNFIKASSDFVSGTMTGNTCVLSETGPAGGAPGGPTGGAPGGPTGGASGGPTGGASGGPPSKAGGEGDGTPTSRMKRKAPTVNLETFAIDNTPFFAVQDKVVRYIHFIRTAVQQLRKINISGLHYFGGSLWRLEKLPVISLCRHRYWCLYLGGA